MVRPPEREKKKCGDVSVDLLQVPSVSFRKYWAIVDNTRNNRWYLSDYKWYTSFFHVCTLDFLLLVHSFHNPILFTHVGQNYLKLVQKALLIWISSCSGYSNVYHYCQLFCKSKRKHCPWHIWTVHFEFFRLTLKMEQVNMTMFSGSIRTHYNFSLFWYSRW